MSDFNRPRGVVFAEDVVDKRRVNKKADTGIISFVIKHSGGLLKTENQAKAFLLAAALLMLAFSFINISHSTTEAEVEVPSGYRLVSPPNQPPRLEKI
jgi:hypothetical protein